MTANVTPGPRGWTPSVVRTLVLALVIAAGTARADDSELFLGDPQATATRANILFVIDTSGSMDTLVATQATFDTTRTYAGCYDSGALYFSASGATPACDNPNVLPKALNRCAASRQALGSLGYYSDFLLGWDGARQRWDVIGPDRPASELECESDRGVHGDGASGENFAANGDDGPWAATEASEPAWTSQYTVYDGNWLNWRSNPPTVQKSRLAIVKEAVNALMTGLRDVNVGVMRFNGNEGGSVIAPVAAIETSRDSVIAIVNAMTASGSTPLSETLYEAAQVFRGANVDYGNAGAIRSVAGSRTGNTIDSPLYRSPITEACGKNFIILLTDGEPNNDSSANSKIAALPGFGTLVGPACDGSGEGRCLDDVAAWLLRQDLSDALPGRQNVVTHTIGFEVDFPLLVSTAARGGGEYHLADDTASLSTALSGIVLSIFDNTGTFAAPAVPVNSFNRTQNLRDVFISVFQPTETARWLGNLKKYRLDGGVLVGRDGRPVIDTTTGLFSREAFSFWSAEPDGDRVSDGGAASRLPLPSARTVLTNLAGTDLVPLNAGNADVRAALSAVPEAERASVINWALGRDVQDADRDGDRAEARRDMGDPFHAQALTLLYSGTVDVPVATVFLTTNDGFLHAFDADTGQELWAVVPGRLLNGLYPLYRNEAAATKTYGLDGEVNLVVLNDDGRPGLSGSERAILLFGMGRGGDGVFAVDVTARNRPVLLWERSSADPGFSSLGQTWSPPVGARVRIGANVTDVAVFGGGYDPGQDNRTFRRDTVGNAIYMVDVRDGTLLWSAGDNETHDLPLREAMIYSIPAPVKPLDLDGDGLAERFYVGDMGGQVWRFDILNGASRDALVQGRVLASLGGAAAGNPATADLRRFYEAPDVVPTILDRKLVIIVNIGSGYRGHPLDTDIDEAFFSIRDFDVFGVPGGPAPSPVTVDQLVDITSDAEPELPFATAGWQLRLVEGPGEKVLGESVTFDNTTFFTTFTPGATVTECTGGAGINRLYAVSIFDGRPRTNFDSPVGEPLTVADRFRTLSTGIPVTDVSLYRTESGPQVCAGTECLTAEELERLRLRQGAVRRTYWFQREGQAD
ncbi:MAG: PQQ-binding-like beta-propeller repeat protein [Chromatiales bacterium]|nr:PQQ-binding-like beta-propeller repeat protein [Chromatiales bacterium]